MLGAWIGSAGGNVIKINVVTKLGLQDWEIMVTTLGYVNRLIFGAYEGIELWWSECYVDGTAYGTLDFLLLGDLCGSVYWVNFGSNKGAELGLWYGKVLCGTIISVERLPLGTYYGII